MMLNLQADGTEGQTIVKDGDGKIYGQIAEEFTKNSDSSYSWNVRFVFTDEENGSYGIWIYPKGINVIVNGQIVKTDTSKVRLYAGHDFCSVNEMSNKIYYKQ